MTRPGRKISVMQLVYSLKMGGSEKVALDIATNLDRQSFEPYVCALDISGELTTELDRVRVPHAVLHRKGLDYGVFGRLYTTLKRWRIDVVHTHHFTQLLFAAVPARLAGARIVHTEHEFFSYSSSAFPRRALKPLLRLTEQMTVVGPEVADYFVGRLHVPRRRLQIVPNGVDLDAYGCDRSIARRELGIPENLFVVGTAGRLESEKNHAQLLDVAAQLRAIGTQVHLLLAGDGSLAGALANHARELGIAREVTFLGYRTDIPRILAAMDVFVLPSLREGLPISLIEAMAARRPVIASDVGSVTSLVRDGENGVVVPVGDAAAIVTSIGRLLEDSELRDRLAGQGRKTVEQSFSLSATLRAYEALYRSAAHEHVRN